MNYRIVRQVVLLGLVAGQTLLIIQLAARTEKAETCNVVFKRYLANVHGINVDLNLIYQDGKKWVNEDRYSE